MRSLRLLAFLTLAGCSPASLPHATVPGTAHAGTRVAGTCSGVAVAPGNDAQVQRVLDGHAPGTTFCFQAGLYRFAAPINPRNGQKLVAAAPGAILNGAKIVSGFVRRGAHFVATGFLQGGRASSTNCWVPNSGCNTPQDVFFGGMALTRVTSIAALTAGSFYEDFANNEIWLRDDPAGGTVEQAYAPSLVASAHGGITVDGFQIEKTATAAQSGAIDARSYVGAGWTIRNDDVAYSHGAGIISAPRDESQGGSTIAHNYIHDNGQEGIAGNGRGLVVKNNEIARNNRVNYSCYWECGGAKFACGPGCEVENLLVTENYVHDNNGNGLWVDIDSYNVAFTHNRVANNRQTNASTGLQIGSGIFLEIGDRGVVADNVVENNGPVANSRSAALFYEGGQILLSATPNVDVHGNTIAGAVGIGMLQQDRSDACRFGASRSSTYPDGTPVCPYHYHFCGAAARGHCTDNYTHWVHDNHIHDNTITETARSGNAEVAGLDCDLGNDAAAFAPSNNNLYDSNAYSLPSLAGRYFGWNNLTTAKGAWLRAGQDAGSAFR